MTILERPEGHQFTRDELRQMSAEEILANRDQILAQADTLGQGPSSVRAGDR